ncbi:hypothetical protein PMAYCL1PPCAC_21098, partial [Pristionchus mayeri]
RCQGKLLAYTATNNECPSEPPKEGDLIVNPGFPPSIPCDYALVVSSGQLVELNIEFLEANECCDYLEIFEGPIASMNHLMEIRTGTDTGIITTKTSNVMTVTWVPGGAVDVRGFKMTFKGIDP